MIIRQQFSASKETSFALVSGCDFKFLGAFPRKGSASRGGRYPVETFRRKPDSALIKVECSFSTSTAGLSNTITERAASFPFSLAPQRGPKGSVAAPLSTRESIRSRSHELNLPVPADGDREGRWRRGEGCPGNDRGLLGVVARATSNRRSLNMRQQARSGAKGGGERGWEEEAPRRRKGKRNGERRFLATGW